MKDNYEIIPFNFKPEFENSTISQLSELKPAGTKLILKSNTDLEDLIKLTFFDLVLKQVLIVKKTLKNSHPKDPHLREYLTVETGKNYSNYLPNKYEEYFIKRIDENSYFFLRAYLKAIFEDIPSNYKYKSQIIKNLKIKNLFCNHIFFSVFSWLKVNTRGKQKRKIIQDYLNHIDNNIVDVITNKPSIALELVSFLKGNIFILNNLNFELYKKLKLTINTKRVNDYGLGDYFLDLDFIFSDIISDTIQIFDSIDAYFSVDNSSDFSGDYDFDFDL